MVSTIPVKTNAVVFLLKILRDNDMSKRDGDFPDHMALPTKPTPSERHGGYKNSSLYHKKALHCTIKPPVSGGGLSNTVASWKIASERRGPIE